MKALVARIRRSSFIKNVAILASGTAIGQAITILSAPVLSRLFSPTSFGVMSVVLAVAAPIAAMASLKYEVAIVLAKDDKDASNLFILSLGLVMVASLLTLLAMPFAGDWLADNMERPAAAPLMMWIPVVVFVSGLSAVITYWANRRRDYLWTSLSTTGRALGAMVVQIALGLAGWHAKGLIVGRVFGITLATVLLAYQTLKNDWREVLRTFDLSRIRALAREHDQFPKYSAPREGIVAISGNVPSIFLALLFTPEAAGLYWFTIRLLEAPTGLVGIAVRRVFFERAAKAFHAGEKIYPLLMKATTALAALGIVPVLIMVAAGPDIFDIAFGDEWRGAGVYARWLTIWWYSSFVNVPTMTLTPIFRLQRLFLGLEIVGLVLRMGAIGAAVFFGNDVLAIALYSIVGFALNVFRIVYVLHFAKYRQHEAVGFDPAGMGDGTS